MTERISRTNNQIASRPAPKSGEVTTVIQPKKTTTRAPALTGKQKVETALGKHIGDNERTHLEGMAPSPTAVKKPETSSNPRPSQSEASPLTSKPSGSKTIPQSKTMAPNTAIKRSRPPPPTETGRKIGDSNRTFIEGMKSSMITKINKPPTRITTPQSSSKRISSQPDQSILPVRPTEMRRRVGDNTRTHLEGLEAPSTNISNLSTSSARTVVSIIESAKSMRVSDKTPDSNGMEPEYLGMEASQATPELPTDDDEPTLYSAPDPDQPTDPNRTVVNMVPTAMSRPLRDNMRTHLERMEKISRR